MIETVFSSSVKKIFREYTNLLSSFKTWQRTWAWKYRCTIYLHNDTNAILNMMNNPLCNIY
jgi:hypothetical protein